MKELVERYKPEKIEIAKKIKYKFERFNNEGIIDLVLTSDEYVILVDLVCKKKKIEPAETNKLVLNATTLYYDYEYRCAGEHNNRFSKLDDEDDLLEEFITITCQPLANHIIESDTKPKHIRMFKHSFQSRIDDILKGDIE